jgi:hypothetical protein
MLADFRKLPPIIEFFVNDAIKMRCNAYNHDSNPRAIAS